MLSESLQASEELASAGATHPRVKLGDIEEAIERVDYLRRDDWPRMGVMTLCLVTMKNGYIIVGKSAPAAPENYNKDKGEQFAYEDCIRQLWPLMGFALRDRLAASNAAEVVNQ